MRNKIIFALGILLACGIFYACSKNTSVAREHPVEVKGLANCAECHTDRWAVLNHQDPGFHRKHRYYAQQEKFACNVCHQESFCADCHAHKEEIKPSDKYKGSPQLNLPHRGDYITRHQIEGRIDPVSCLKCHGRTNNERCRACHR